MKVENQEEQKKGTADTGLHKTMTLCFSFTPGLAVNSNKPRTRHWSLGESHHLPEFLCRTSEMKDHLWSELRGRFTAMMDTGLCE